MQAATPSRPRGVAGAERGKEPAALWGRGALSPRLQRDEGSAVCARCPSTPGQVWPHLCCRCAWRAGTLRPLTRLLSSPSQWAQTSPWRPAVRTDNGWPLSTETARCRTPRSPRSAGVFAPGHLLTRTVFPWGKVGSKDPRQRQDSPSPCSFLRSAGLTQDPALPSGPPVCGGIWSLSGAGSKEMGVAAQSATGGQLRASLFLPKKRAFCSGGQMRSWDWMCFASGHLRSPRGQALSKSSTDSCPPYSAASIGGDRLLSLN